MACVNQEFKTFGNFLMSIFTHLRYVALDAPMLCLPFMNRLLNDAEGGNGDYSKNYLNKSKYNLFIFLIICLDFGKQHLG